MKIKKPQIYTQILIGLIAGVIFGLLFPVHGDEIGIAYKEGTSINRKYLYGWQKASIEVDGSVQAQFEPGNNNKFIKSYELFKEKKNVRILFIFKDGKTEAYSNVVRIL